MKLDKKAESIASVLIAVVILSAALFGILSVLTFSRDVMYNYSSDTDEKILGVNSENIVNKLDLSEIKENETFYIYKDNFSKIYTIFTGSVGETYKYIDVEGNNVLPESFDGKIYEREFKKGGNIIKYIIGPENIPERVLKYEKTSSGDIIDSKPGIVGNSEQKSFLAFITTQNDILSRQDIYKSGDLSIGYNIYIENGELFASAYNTPQWPNYNKIKSINLGKIFPNYNYFITIIHDSSSKDSDGQYIGGQNTFKAYLNGTLKGELTNIMPQTEHLGFIVDNSITQEFLSWNYALNESEINGLNEYLNEKWLNNNTSIEYNTIEINIKEYTSN